MLNENQIIIFSMKRKIKVWGEVIETGHRVRLLISHFATFRYATFNYQASNSGPTEIFLTLNAIIEELFAEIRDHARAQF